MNPSSCGSVQRKPSGSGIVSTVHTLKDRLKKGERWLVEINLAGTQMEGLNLAKIWAKEADFRGARLRRANFRSAMILKADFEGADLRGANLCGASFNDANFSKADLRGANLSGSDVDCANFRGALYNISTRWPKGFDPDAEGAMIFRESHEPLRNSESSSTMPWAGRHEDSVVDIGSILLDS